MPHRVGSTPARKGRSVGASKIEQAVDDRDAALRIFREEGCSSPRPWGNGPGDTYARHAHDYHKVLFCLDGSITFHLEVGDVTLEPGDRLDLPPDTVHSATVGAQGCSCIEASR
jgi:mannose-6-phosphate isomerase-like protein (cupin superfamily)